MADINVGSSSRSSAALPQNEIQAQFKENNEYLYRSQFPTEESYRSVSSSGFGSWWGGVKESASMFSDWVFGKGEDHQIFKPGSVQVDMLRNAPRVEAARDYFIEKNKSIPLEYQQSVTNYAAGFGLKGLWGAGVDPIEQFVGSYDINIHANSNGTVAYELNNTTSMKSFLYGMFFSWERESLGFGGNMRQTYSWVEENPTIGKTNE